MTLVSQYFLRVIVYSKVWVKNTFCGTMNIEVLNTLNAEQENNVQNETRSRRSTGEVEEVVKYTIPQHRLHERMTTPVVETRLKEVSTQKEKNIIINY